LRPEAAPRRSPARRAGFPGTSSVRSERLIHRDQVILDQASRARRRPRHQRSVIGAAGAQRHALAGLRRIRWGLVASDAVSAMAVALVLGAGHLASDAVWVHLWFIAVVSPFVWVAVFHSFGLYRPTLSSWDVSRRLLGATAFGVLLLAMALPREAATITRSSLLWTAATALSLEVFARGLFRWQAKSLTRDGGLALRTAVIGTRGEAGRIAGALSAEDGTFAMVGRIAIEEDDGLNGEGPSALGTLGELEEIVARNQIECVFVASIALPRDDVLRISKLCRQAGVEMRLWANIPDILTPRLSIQPLADSAVLALTPVRLSGANAALKRLFDVVVATLGVILTLPLLAAVALGIRLSSSGPVFFRQARVTKNGRTFTMYKFRTMVNDPEKALAGRVVDLTEPFFKLEDDPRLTRFGRLLRRWSLDELPQLFNVLRGDMSIVGPRPLPAEQVGANLDLLAARHEVRCGITGWWQVSGRSEIDSVDALRLDLYYIENWSIGLDLYILLRTAGAVLAKKGAW
jgi:exopolysaccharide biosynthesis polyprenyl glycosylphosphotransferase